MSDNIEELTTAIFDKDIRDLIRSYNPNMPEKAVEHWHKKFREFFQYNFDYYSHQELQLFCRLYLDKAKLTIQRYEQHERNR